jgi:hypothetical protein
MMQPTQHRFREHDEALANYAMSGWLGLERDIFRRRIGHAGSKRHVGTRPRTIQNRGRASRGSMMVETEHPTEPDSSFYWALR